MKIGDRVFVRGYIDEIRKDTVIIRNAGGYFGTIPSEVITGELPSAQPENQVHLCDSCRHIYPECPSGKDDVIYGNGKGNDNICACNKYEPSAQPERKRGKWKRAYLDHEAMGERPHILYCSACNQCIAYPTNFCPNCGADMREGEE